MLNSKPLTVCFLFLLLFLKAETALAQAPVIKPKNNIVLKLDANGNYTTNLSDVATVTPAANITLNPASFNCSKLGPQVVTVTAARPQATFSYLAAITSDASGNLYLAQANGEIRKISPNGIVTTIVATGTNLDMYDPKDLEILPNGDLYETSFTTVLKITPAGGVSIFSGQSRVDDESGTEGYSAGFSIPCGIVADNAGNFYVADDRTDIIRKITPDGYVTNLAGGGAQGFADGQGDAARFNRIIGLAIDKLGNIYVVDNSNHCIRKVTPGGNVTTFAGTGVRGQQDGPAATATFSGPSGITIDAAGNLYVVDYGDEKIRKITPAGMVSTLAGSGDAGSADGIGSQASFYLLGGITTDAAGNVYVCDGGNNKIRKITPAGVVSTYAGSSEQGNADGYATVGPNDISTVNIPVTVISNPVFEPMSPLLGADANCQAALPDYTKLAKVSPCADKLKIIQSPAAGTVVNAALPVNVTLTATDGFGGKGTTSFNVSVSATPVITPNQQPIVLTLDATGKYQVKLSDVATVSTCNNPVSTITPSSFGCTDVGDQTVTVEAHNPSPAEFNYPVGMVYDASGNLYVVDRNNHAVRKITPDGIASTLAGTGNEGHSNGKGTAASFGDINAITIDSHGNLYVTDYKYADIRKITPDGTVTTFVGNIACNQMVMDKQDNMFVTTIHACLKKITPDGMIYDFAGIEAIGYLDGTGTSARFSFIDGITIDGSGNLYVLDYGNYKIRMITPNAVVTTLPINGGFVPGGYVAIDGFGNLFIASSERVWERKINGECVDFVGSNIPSGPGNNDGTGTAAKFNTVQGVVFDSSGNLLVADAVDNSIRKITSAAQVSTYAGGIQGYYDGAIAHGISVYAAIPVTVVGPQALVPSVKVTPDSYGGCEGQSLTYTAIATNAGNNPAYQWKVNGQNAGGNAAEFTSSTLKTGDKITCTITASGTCAVATATSNEVSLTADPTVSNSVSITSTAVNNVIKPGQQVTFTAKAAVTDNVVYQWLVNGVSAGTNSPGFTANSMQNGDAVTCTVTTYGKCIATPYVVSNTLTMTIYAPVDVVNTFTPNGDGINDTWEIPSLSVYPNCMVNIFSRYGTMVYKSTGYARAWDGTFNTKPVPTGTYYYIIDLKNGKDKITGAVTVLR